MVHSNHHGARCYVRTGAPAVRSRAAFSAIPDPRHHRADAFSIPVIHFNRLPQFANADHPMPMIRPIINTVVQPRRPGYPRALCGI
jgi:hypothetical protein